MIKNKKVISTVIFMSLGLLGLLFPAVGASLPAIEEYFDIGLSSSGQVSTLVQLGYALFCFAGGIISDIFGKKRILIIGTIIYGLSGISLSFSNNWILTLILFFIFGCGSGMIFISSNTLVIDLFSKNAGTYLNIHHTFFAFGSLTAPFIVRAFLYNQMNWYSIFFYLGILSLFIGLLISLSNINISRSLSINYKPKIKRIPKAQYLKILQDRRFIMLLLILFLAIGVQFGIIYLLVSFLIKVKLVEFGIASLVMSAFFAFLLIGRLICGYLVARIDPHKVVMGLMLLLIGTLLSGWLLDGRIALFMFALTGLASSGLMPTLISIASVTQKPEVRASALGLLSMAGGLGGMLITLLVSGLSDSIGFENSFLIMIAISIIGGILFISILIQNSKNQS